MSALEYKRSILAAMQGTLAASGFRRSGAVSRRALGDVVQLVELQSSTRSSVERLVVTLNLAVVSTALQAQGGDPAPTPSVASAHWRERIGHLLPIHRDYWWEIAQPNEAQGAAKEIADAIRGYALPILDRLSSTSRLKELWETGVSPGITERQRRMYLSTLYRMDQSREPVT
jgi:hypothetical protein